MTRYSGNTNSKSINARLAERDGRLPATAMAADLRRRGLFAGVTGADIAAAVVTGEWHHSGSFAAHVNYYSLDQIYACRRTLREAIAARKAAPKSAGEKHDGCTAEWLEWTGDRRHPRATDHRAENIAATVKGRFVTLHLPAGDIRKQLGARGFTLRLPSGKKLL